MNRWEHHRIVSGDLALAFMDERRLLRQAARPERVRIESGGTRLIYTSILALNAMAGFRNAQLDLPPGRDWWRRFTVSAARAYLAGRTLR